jgi:hypothetical protein
MGNKKWPCTMLPWMMKKFESDTTADIYNGLEGILVGC